MRKLRLVGLSSDRQHVVYVDDAGHEFAAPADDRLRAALRGDRARLGQLEIEMDSALRPRDIQARVRAGEAPEAVAALAGVPVDRIMGYCVPVIAERQHVAELAGRSHVRRKNAEGPARRLGEVVGERLRSRGIDPESATWDAWRRDDGRWIVHATYHSGEQERSASFVYDAAGRYSLADDDEAKWLTGERQRTSKGPQPREGVRSSAARRLSAVPADDDLLSLTETSDADEDLTGDETSDDLTAVIRAVRELDAPPEPAASDADGGPEGLPEQSRLDDATDQAAHQRGDPLTPTIADPPADDSTVEPAPERRRRARRASMPSWDEIMLGRRRDG
jgi:hypothetical protein